VTDGKHSKAKTRAPKPAVDDPSSPSWDWILRPDSARDVAYERLTDSLLEFARVAPQLQGPALQLVRTVIDYAYADNLLAPGVSDDSVARALTALVRPKSREAESLGGVRSGNSADVVPETLAGSV